MATVVRGRVESLAYGPHGVLRVDGKVYLVRGVAPGDEVEIEVREDRGRYAFGEVRSVIDRSASYRTPPCGYLPDCGGCPWQHVREEAQLEGKLAILLDLLRRVGGLTISTDSGVVEPLLAPGPPLGYRRRLSLRVEARKVGFFAGGSQRLIEVSRCLLAVPELEGGIELAGDLVRRLRTKIKRIELTMASGADNLLLGLQAEGPLVPGDGAVVREFRSAKVGRIAGVSLWGRGWRHVEGRELATVSLPGGDSMDVTVGDFSQVSESGNLALIDTVLRLARPAGGDRVLDLYCGAGNLSIPLARLAAQVTGVERSTSSTKRAAENAHRLGLTNLQFVAQPVGDYLRTYRDSVTLVVLDPPRSGAAEAVPALLRMAPKRILYVSCDPATLARDLRGLVAGGYLLERVQPIDLFPQTYHLETVVALRRDA